MALLGTLFHHPSVSHGYHLLASVSNCGSNASQTVPRMSFRLSKLVVPIIGAVTPVQLKVNTCLSHTQLGLITNLLLKYTMQQPLAPC